jgi:hypothetical protein
MARFLITYHGSERPADPEAMEQTKAAFGQWASETGDALVDPGAPLKLASQVAAGDPTVPVEIGGYSIIEADNLDSAVALLRSHPFVGRGGTLQVNQVLGT